MVDLTPKYSIPSAEVELALDPGSMPMGYSVGGVSAFNNSFKRGYGDNVWGVDERGQWMGAADFDDANWRVTMAGLMYFASQSGNFVIDAVNNRLVIYDDDGVARIVIGFLLNGF